jgi:hypothetical protein
MEEVNTGPLLFEVYYRHREVIQLLLADPCTGTFSLLYSTKLVCCLTGKKVKMSSRYRYADVKRKRRYSSYSLFSSAIDGGD